MMQLGTSSFLDEVMVFSKPEKRLITAAPWSRAHSNAVGGQLRRKTECVTCFQKENHFPCVTDTNNRSSYAKPPTNYIWCLWIWCHLLLSCCDRFLTERIKSSKNQETRGAASYSVPPTKENESAAHFQWDWEVQSATYSVLARSSCKCSKLTKVPKHCHRLRKDCTGKKALQALTNLGLNFWA